MKNIIVTGASGFLGQAVVPKLLASGYHVHAISSQPKVSDHPNLIWHTYDLLDVEKLSLLFNSVEAQTLLHLAWYVAPGKWYEAKENYYWVEASLHLSRLFVEHGGSHLVIVGSGTEYDWELGYCSESKPSLNPNTFYGQCKHSLHQLLRGYCRATDIDLTWARVFFVYGPNESPTRLVPAVINALLHKEPALCSHGNQVRDYLHVNDVASAFLELIEQRVVDAINIASGQPVRLRDMVTCIAHLMDGQELIQLGAIPAAANDTPLVVADNSRLRQETSWQQSYSLEQGLLQTINWWKARQ